MGGREGGREVNGILQTEESAKERERESVRNVLLGVVSMGRLYFRACCFSFFPLLFLCELFFND